jgi:YHS domain-containing protein
MEGCCCGNEFAVGPRAVRDVRAPTGYELRTDTFVAPWGERISVAWAIGPSTHDTHSEDALSHEHERDEAHGHPGGERPTRAIDPVCGMSVDPATALAKDLHLRYDATDFFFCGRGCKLEFGDDPDRYLDTAYLPSM